MILIDFNHDLIWDTFLFMNQAATANSDTLKLISLGRVSCERGDDEHNLNTYHVLNNALQKLSEGSPVKGDHVLKCLALFRVLVKLHQKVLSSKNIKKNLIPDVYKPAAAINDLLIKSAKDAVANGDRKYITEQCETLLSVANIIRYEEELRILGILEARLKNAIGELRAKADIVSVFQDEDRQMFDDLINKVENILRQGDFEQIGLTILKLESISEKLKNKYTTSLSFTNYLRSYKQNYINKIKNTINEYISSIADANLYERKEIVDKLSLLEDMEVYHQDHNLTLRVKKLKRKITNYSIVPLENKLKDMIDYIASLYNNPHWFEYETIYENKYRECDVFTDTFYEYTLNGLTSEEVEGLLQKKIYQLKQLDLEKLSHINFEEKLIRKINLIIAAFTNPGSKLSQKK